LAKPMLVTHRSSNAKMCPEHLCDLVRSVEQPQSITRDVHKGVQAGPRYKAGPTPINLQSPRKANVVAPWSIVEMIAICRRDGRLGPAFPPSVLETDLLEHQHEPNCRIQTAKARRTLKIAEAPLVALSAPQNDLLEHQHGRNYRTETAKARRTLKMAEAPLVSLSVTGNDLLEHQHDPNCRTQTATARRTLKIAEAPLVSLSVTGNDLLEHQHDPNCRTPLVSLSVPGNELLEHQH
jgi:hypothetical protein